MKELRYRLIYSKEENIYVCYEQIGWSVWKRVYPATTDNWTEFIK